MSEVFERTVHQLDVQGVELQVAALERGGDGAPILFLHGFGSTKEDMPTSFAIPPSTGGSPAHSMPPACATRCEPARCGRSSLPWSIFPTMAG